MRPQPSASGLGTRCRKPYRRLPNQRFRMLKAPPCVQGVHHFTVENMGIDFRVPHYVFYVCLMVSGFNPLISGAFAQNFRMYCTFVRVFPHRRVLQIMFDKPTLLSPWQNIGQGNSGPQTLPTVLESAALETEMPHDMREPCRINLVSAHELQTPSHYRRRDFSSRRPIATLKAPTRFGQKTPLGVGFLSHVPP